VTTLEVLEFLRTCSPASALVYPSSAAVYGRAASMPIREDAPLNPTSPYGVHKKAAEDLCRSYARSYGIRVAIVRLFSAYGAELRKQLLWDACRKGIAGDGSFAGTGRETRDWIHADDVAALLIAAADHAGPEAVIVNGATGEEVAIDAVLGVLFDALGITDPPRFTGLSRPGDPARYAGDPSRAAAWGWSPTRTWADGVREYARWYRQTSA
jgi:UDP-glucose 4-epimerase